MFFVKQQARRAATEKYFDQKKRRGKSISYVYVSRQFEQEGETYKSVASEKDGAYFLI